MGDPTRCKSWFKGQTRSGRGGDHMCSQGRSSTPPLVAFPPASMGRNPRATLRFHNLRLINQHRDPEGRRPLSGSARRARPDSALGEDGWRVFCVFRGYFPLQCLSPGTPVTAESSGNVSLLERAGTAFLTVSPTGRGAMVTMTMSRGQTVPGAHFLWSAGRGCHRADEGTQTRELSRFPVLGPPSRWPRSRLHSGWAQCPCK